MTNGKFFLLVICTLVSCTQRKQESKVLKTMNHWTELTMVVEKNKNQSSNNRSLYKKIKWEKVREKLFIDPDFNRLLKNNCEFFFHESACGYSGSYLFLMKVEKVDTVYKYEYTSYEQKLNKTKYIPKDEGYDSFSKYLFDFSASDSSYCIFPDSTQNPICFLKCYVNSCQEN